MKPTISFLPVIAVLLSPLSLVAETGNPFAMKKAGPEPPNIFAVEKNPFDVEPKAQYNEYAPKPPKSLSQGEKKTVCINGVCYLVEDDSDPFSMSSEAGDEWTEVRTVCPICGRVKTSMVKSSKMATKTLSESTITTTYLPLTTHEMGMSTLSGWPTTAFAWQGDNASVLLRGNVMTRQQWRQNGRNPRHRPGVLNWRWRVANCFNQ